MKRMYLPTLSLKEDNMLIDVKFHDSFILDNRK